MPEPNRPLIAGSISNPLDAAKLDASSVACCDVLEIRLDGIPSSADLTPSLWQHLRGVVPILLTARCAEEGGAGNWSVETRIQMLANTCTGASCIDLEVANIPVMAEIIETAKEIGLPWIASYHDFQSVPERDQLEAALGAARNAGAAVFKCAAMIREPADLARLADFQRAHPDFPVSTMGMGPLAVVSRLLCAQCGSVLNYGYLGGEATAPGQWDAASLAKAIHQLPALPA